MTDASPWIAACEHEPIHAPGAIQGWGALLVADEADQVIRHASANLEEFVGHTAAEAIGRPLADVIDPAIIGRLLAPGANAPARGSPLGGKTGAPPRAMVGHRLAGSLIVEIRPDHDEGGGKHGMAAWTDARAVVEALRAAASTSELFATAARELRRATGFDRAMVYRFDAIGHGEVVAEDRAPDLPPFLGLRYPASDVPRQARRLYLRQRVRLIADAAAPAVALLGAADAAPSPDLSVTTLRAVSPIHLEYMLNMGVRASIAVSLTVDGVLWGMLVCHHRAPRLASSATQALCDLIAQVAAMMIATLREAEARVAERERAERVAAVARRLAARHDGAAGLAGALADLAPGLLGICGARGAIARLGGETVALGEAPTGRAAASLLDALLRAAPDPGDLFANTESGPLLPADVPPEWRSRVAGTLLLPILHGPSDGIVWLRPEQALTMHWGGDPRLAASVDAASGKLSPRRSFAVWREEVRGRAEPWGKPDLDAALALRREIDQHLARFAEAELERMRHHDPLTGLSNRRLLRDRLERWSHERPSSCLLMVDLDRFKALNDALGETTGDALLVQASERLTRVARPSGALVARVGASEFAVFSDRMDSEAAGALAEMIRAELAEPFMFNGAAIGVTASVGIAPVTGETPGVGPKDLLTLADLALQAAKQGGGNRALVYHDRLRAGADRRIELEQELRAAIKGDSERAGRFDLLYQPCVALTARQGGEADRPNGRKTPPLRGFEALLRWEHPRLGAIAPSEFVGVAEECGLIDVLGDWVLRRAIGQLAEWRAIAVGVPVETWRIAVNVSPRQLGRPGFAAEVARLLAERDVPPRCLTIEVTEGVFADEDATRVIGELREAGIKIAVDDFGVGYSSLSYIRRLPADELKFDRSFLQSADGAPRHEEFLGALVRMARAAGLSVLAEGVETEEHLAAVAAAGCDAAQGWLFARAMPAAEAAAWIEAAPKWPTARPPRAPLPFSFRDIVETIGEAVMVTTADLEPPGPTIVYVNPAFTRMCGYTLGEVLGRTPRFLQGPRTDVKALASLGEDLRAGRPARALLVNYASSGMPYWLEMRISPLRDQDGRVTHLVAVERDVTHDMRRLDELELLAERDPLTSIANRRGIERFAARLLGQPGAPLCVACIDLDGFKRVNDTLGHAAGDALLLGVADLLAENMRRVDFVGRLGGDEFLVGMPSILPADALAVAKRLRRMIAAREFQTQAGPARTDCSIGVAAARPGETGIDAAIARADAAMYVAKHAGGGRVVLDDGAPNERDRVKLTPPEASEVA